MALGDKIKKRQQLASQLVNFQGDDLKKKKNVCFMISMYAEDRQKLKQWAKDEGHGMSVIVKRALYEYYLRHEMEHEKIKQRRLENQERKRSKREVHNSENL